MEKNYDVIIIGAGPSGIFCAYEMKEKDGNKYPEYTITVGNLNVDLKVLIINDFYTLDYREFKNKGDNTGSLGVFSEGERVTITTKAYTADECSTRTVATKMIKYCIDKAKNDGYKAVYVDVVPTNTPARGLFGKNGFKYLGDFNLDRKIGRAHV